MGSVRTHRMNGKSISLQTILLALLVGMTSSSPLPDQSSPGVEASEESWLMTSEDRSRSHLLMWMMTQKQLIPRVHALVDSATGLLRCTCGEEGKHGVEECLALAASLPSIPHLSDVPSQRVIQNENKKIFVKSLLENAHHSLKEVQTLLWSDVTPAGLGQCGGSHGAQHFMDSLQTATTQYENMLTSFYKSKASPPTTVEVPSKEFSSERLLAIKLLYVAVNHLNQVSSALEYSVQFSWFSRMTSAFYNKGRKLGGRRKSKKNKDEK